jgi:hypothetical protein
LLSALLVAHVVSDRELVDARIKFMYHFSGMSDKGAQRPDAALMTNWAHCAASHFVFAFEHPKVMNNHDRDSPNWSPGNHDAGDEDRRS